MLNHVGRVGPTEERVKEHSVEVAVGAPGSGQVVTVVASGPDGRKVERDSDRPGPRRAQRLGSQPVPE